MERRFVFLAGAVCAASSVLATPRIVDRSVVGRWTFDDATDRGKDSSGYGAASLSLPSGMGFSATGGFSGGRLDITTSGATATATLGSGMTVPSPGLQTVAVRFKSNLDQTIPSMGDNGLKAIIADLNDKNDWHFAALRYQKGLTSSKCAWMLATDPDSNAFWSDTKRSETAAETDSDKPYIPLSVLGTAVTFGGKVAATSYNYKGLLDEAVVVNRMMTKNELTRLYQTGETYIFIATDINVAKDITGDNRKTLFSGYWFWTTRQEYASTDPADKSPGAFPGAAYIVDQGATMLTVDDAVFGGDLSKKVSLTLGRAADLKNRRTGDTIVAASTGNLTQAGGAGTGVSFYDLRLNNGQFWVVGGDNQYLATTLLDLGSTDLDQPFDLYIKYNGTYVLDAGGSVTGSGVLAVRGEAGSTLDLRNFMPAPGTDTPRVRLVSGSIKTKYLNGFLGGTLLVDTQGAVDFRGNDKYAAWPLTVRCTETLSAGKYPILTVPTSHRATMTTNDVVLATAPALADPSLVCEKAVETVGGTHTFYRLFPRFGKTLLPDAA